MVTILKYKKSTIDRDIYIKALSGVTVSYFIDSTDDFFNTTNDETESTELARVFEEYFDMKIQVRF